MACILIADDVTFTREALARALREHGHEVLPVADGQEAVERFGREQVEAAVMDVNMPRLSGLEACARMKAMPGRFTPIILVSSRADLDSKRAALQVADDFVAKPYDPAEIAARLQAHLRTRRLVEELRQPRGAEGGLKPRALLLERLQEEWLRAVRFNEPLSLLLLAGDKEDSALLGQLGDATVKVLRQIDVVARFSQREICALLPNTHVTGALVAAARLKRELVATAASASMGIAFYPGRDIAQPDDLVRTAERALARARDEGPGSICIYQHQGYLFSPQ